MPHISVKYFPIELEAEKVIQFREKMVHLVSEYFKCSQDVISIALEPIEQNLWKSEVYNLEIVGKASLLIKSPNYTL